MDIITKAKEFASHAHKDHVRNDKAKTPYVLHLEEVANLVKESGGSDSEIAAAWLHDSVEDTQTTIDDIRQIFGDEVRDIVEGLTDIPEWRSLALGRQKAMQADRIVKESISIKRVKLADQTSNVRIVGLVDDNFSLEDKFIYIDGAKQIAEVCKGVSPYLDKLFEELYNQAAKNLRKIRENASI